MPRLARSSTASSMSVAMISTDRPGCNDWMYSSQSKARVKGSSPPQQPALQMRSGLTPETVAINPGRTYSFNSSQCFCPRKKRLTVTASGREAAPPPEHRCGYVPGNRDNSQGPAHVVWRRRDADLNVAGICATPDRGPDRPPEENGRRSPLTSPCTFSCPSDRWDSCYNVIR